MKFADNPQQATDSLRQAIPMMVKYSIPPNPLNYSLWYAYVSGALPELNKKLDNAIEVYGTCPNLVSEELFREFLIKDDVENAEAIQNALFSVMGNLESSVSNTAQNTQAYNKVLQTSLEALKGSQNDQDLENIIQNLSENTETIRATTREFQAKIDAAQAEINALKEELARSRQDATKDPLTGLYNRRVFDAEIAQLTEQTAPDVCLVMVDIDYFKKFNDTYGHQMGDKVLKYVAKLMIDSCKPPMLPIRFGGEEFAFLLPGHSVDQAVAVAEQLRQKIMAIRIKQKKTGEVISSVTASFGVARLVAEESPDSLIERADKALYNAKNAGRNNVQLAS